MEEPQSEAFEASDVSQLDPQLGLRSSFSNGESETSQQPRGVVAKLRHPFAGLLFLLLAVAAASAGISPAGRERAQAPIPSSPSVLVHEFVGSPPSAEDLLPRCETLQARGGGTCRLPYHPALKKILVEIQEVVRSAGKSGTMVGPHHALIPPAPLALVLDAAVTAAPLKGPLLGLFLTAAAAGGVAAVAGSPAVRLCRFAASSPFSSKWLSLSCWVLAANDGVSGSSCYVDSPTWTRLAPLNVTSRTIHQPCKQHSSTTLLQQEQHIGTLFKKLAAAHNLEGHWTSWGCVGPTVWALVLEVASTMTAGEEEAVVGALELLNGESSLMHFPWLSEKSSQAEALQQVESLVVNRKTDFEADGERMRQRESGVDLGMSS
ncbi:hypothetical protein ACSSS7_004864 [Eimeria intestinalis]